MVDGTKPKKPPKKERKKSVRSAIVNTVNGTLNRSETAEICTPAAELHLDDQFGMASSPAIKEKRDSTFVDMALKLSTLGVHGYKVHSPGVVPPAKRPKMISPAQLPLSDDPETVLDTRNSGNHNAGKELRDGMLAANNTPYSFEHQMSRQVNGCFVLAKDAPAPLASKIYYSQRNLRLRSAVRIMYNEWTDNNMSSSNGLQELVKLPHITSSTCLSDERVKLQPDTKAPNQFLSSGSMPDQNVTHSSEACLNKREELSPAGFSSQVLHTNHRSRSRTASVGIPKNQYLSQSHSFASNSGTIQQPNGSVPVI